MPRQARIDAPDAIHHIICRGIERRKIFADDTDRDSFVLRLSSVLAETSTRCYAWTLIPNHFHLLLQTGMVPISTVMRRLLTGYAVSFNHRHKRNGNLFQNRYKSILCQKETYLLELIRYIHLNPLRAHVVSSPAQLAEYRYSGHILIIGGDQDTWFATDDILQHFGGNSVAGQRKYLRFITEGIPEGKRPDLIGGGLVRSSGGWRQIKAARESGEFLKSDERILGDGNFVEAVLRRSEEQLAEQPFYQQHGEAMDRLIQVVAARLEIEPAEVMATGKQPHRVKARSLLCYWSVRELGLTATAVASRLGLSPAAASQAVQRGEKLVAKNGWLLGQPTTKES